MNSIAVCRPSLIRLSLVYARVRSNHHTMEGCCCASLHSRCTGMNNKSHPCAQQQFVYSSKKAVTYRCSIVITHIMMYKERMKVGSLHYLPTRSATTDQPQLACWEGMATKEKCMTLLCQAQNVKCSTWSHWCCGTVCETHDASSNLVPSWPSSTKALNVLPTKHPLLSNMSHAVLHIGGLVCKSSLAYC